VTCTELLFLVDEMIAVPQVLAHSLAVPESPRRYPWLYQLKGFFHYVSTTLRSPRFAAGSGLASGVPVSFLPLK